MARAIFVSDVHLHPAEPDRTGRFLSFLDYVRGERFPNLFILGDLFHFWVGPKHAALPDYRPVLDTLGRVVAAGVKTVFFHGNRDFHVGTEFSRDLGIRVVKNHLELGIGGGRTIYVAHGDLLCAKDFKYRRMRRVIRSAPLVKLYRAMPLWMSLGIGNLFRKMSEAEVKRKTTRELQLSMPEVEAILARGPKAAILGHVHKAELRGLEVAGETKFLATLGAWDEGVSYLTLEGGKLTLFDGKQLGETAASADLGA